MATRNNLIETIDPKTAAASTVFKAGDWIQSDALGAFVPLTPAHAVEGLCLENITAQDPNFAQEKLIHCDMIDHTIDRWLMPVTVGVATANMEGLTFDVDPADASALDVSSSGTQFMVTRFIRADLVEVKVMLCCEAIS